jgi:tRNA(Arg) A34 adenosine deaminase TadA
MATAPSIPEINRILDQAIRLAAANVAAGGGPFGALVVTPNGRIHEGVNHVTRDNDPTAHAEVVAIRTAAAAVRQFRPQRCRALRQLRTTPNHCPGVGRTLPGLAQQPGPH